MAPPVDAGAATAHAEALAIAGLGFLADDPERLGRFLSMTGIGPETLRRAAAEPGFLVAVLDHLMTDDALLMAFCANRGFDPEIVARARAVLGGAVER